MESLAAQPKSEQLRSFDQLASIDMLRFDQQRFGMVLPETRERVYDEELSYVTEGIDRASRTAFVLQSHEGSLQYFNQGAWQPYVGMLMTGLEVAKAEAAADPRRQFLADRAADDLIYGYQMSKLTPGQKLTWYSSFPEAEATRYGDTFMKELGFKPHRRMGFIYQAERLENGQVMLKSQTVDRSNEESFGAVMKATEHDPTADLNTLTRIYDGTLVKQSGGRYYAGRRSAEINENVWDEVRKHGDLIGYYMQTIEDLATAQMPRHELEEQAKRARYRFWAALSKRLEQPMQAIQPDIRGYDPRDMQRLAHESNQAFGEFARKGRQLIGCGSATVLSGEQAILDADGKDVFDSIFGNNEEAYTFDKKMHCVVCQAPPKQKAEKKWCGPCGICKLCDVKVRSRAAGAFALAA